MSATKLLVWNQRKPPLRGLASHVGKRNGGMVDLITPNELIPQPCELVLRNGAPDTIAE